MAAAEALELSDDFSKEFHPNQNHCPPPEVRSYHPGMVRKDLNSSTRRLEKLDPGSRPWRRREPATLHLLTIPEYER